MPLDSSRFTYALTLFWYVAPPAPPDGTSPVPSQHCSFSGTRTVWTFQVFIALIEAWSIGPFHMPLPWMQANSPPERLTPSSRYVAPDEVTRRLPDTCNAGAAPVFPPLGLTLADALGDDVTAPSSRHCCWLTPVQDHSCT